MATPSALHPWREVFSKLLQGERRQRARRPLLLTLFAAALLLSPFVNFASRAHILGIPGSEPLQVLRTYEIGSFLLLVAPIPVAIGLLMVKTWAWWLFVIYAPALAIYDLAVMFQDASTFNTAALLQTVFCFAAMGYFLRRDVYVPYWSPVSRGFRSQVRHGLEVPVRVDDVAARTRDIGNRGCFVYWPECDRQPGSSVHLELDLGGTVFKLRCGVARVDAAGAALAFRNLDEATKQALDGALAAERTRTPS